MVQMYLVARKLDDWPYTSSDQRSSLRMVRRNKQSAAGISLRVYFLPDIDSRLCCKISKFVDDTEL